MFNIQTVSFILIVRMSLKIIFHAKAANSKRLFYDLTINLQSCNILMTFLGIFWILFLELWLHKHNTMTRLLQQQVSMYAAAYLKNLRGPFHKGEYSNFPKIVKFFKVFGIWSNICHLRIGCQINLTVVTSVAEIDTRWKIYYEYHPSLLLYCFRIHGAMGTTKAYDQQGVVCSRGQISNCCFALFSVHAYHLLFVCK